MAIATETAIGKTHGQAGRALTTACALTIFASTLSPQSLAQETDASEENRATAWSTFRGKDAHGIAEGYDLPEEWDLESGENVRWKTPIPGLAHSSPVIWGDSVFVTTAVRQGADSELSSLYGSPGYGADRAMYEEGDHSFRLYCLSADTGDVRWEREAHAGPPAIKRHIKSSHANPTPVCDATRVLAFFASEGLYCYDHDGELLWKRDLGRLDSGAPDLDDWDTYEWGFASSPVLHNDRVYLQCDIQDQSFITALDATDGTEIWRTDRNERPTWGTPTVYTGPDAKPQIIVNGYLEGGGYDLDNGEPIWWYSGGGDSPVPTPIVHDGLVFLSSAHGRVEPLTAFQINATGEVAREASSEFVAWHKPQRGIYMQTPLVYDGLLYCCSDGGILACYDPKTGERLYRSRLGTGTTGFSGSAVAGDGKLYFSGESGRVFVIKAGPEFEFLAANEFGETLMSTPAISRGTMFFRARHHVIAVGGGEDS